MIFVEVRALQSEGRGRSTANGWYDTDSIQDAIGAALDSFQEMWDHLGEGAAITYTITVAPEASPRRTKQGQPLPVREERRA